MLTDRQTRAKNTERTTSCIVHLADSVSFKGVTTNKLCNGLTGSCSEMPNDTIHVNVVPHTAPETTIKPNAMIEQKKKEIREFCESNSDPEIVAKYSKYFKEGFDGFGIDNKVFESQIAKWIEDWKNDMSLQSYLDLSDYCKIHHPWDTFLLN